MDAKAKRLIAVLASTLLLCSISASAATKVVLSNDISAQSLKGHTFAHLKQQIKKRLGNAVKVSVYNSGTLFNQETEVQGLELGSADIIAPTAGIYSNVAPHVNVLLLPFMLNTPKKIEAAIKNPVIRKTFAPELEKKNIIPMTIWMNGPRDHGCRSAKPTLTPKELSGRKVRVQSAPIFLKTHEALGANPVAMDWTEVPTALQQGVIDCAEPTPNAWKASSNYQFIKELTLDQYVYSFYIVGVSKNWWHSLPRHVRSGIRAALKETTHWNWARAHKVNQDAIKFMSKHGVKIYRLNASQRAKWQQAVRPVWKELGTDKVGAKVMHKLETIASSK